MYVFSTRDCQNCQINIKLVGYVCMLFLFENILKTYLFLNYTCRQFLDGIESMVNWHGMIQHFFYLSHSDMWNTAERLRLGNLDSIIYVRPETRISNYDNVTQGQCRYSVRGFICMSKCQAMYSLAMPCLCSAEQSRQVYISQIPRDSLLFNHMHQT